jgi:hypothetical protein
MPVTFDIPAAEAAIVEMTNAFRRENKLSRLTENPQLAAAARAYAKKLAAGSGLSHEADGTTPATRAVKVGYTYCQIAENLAKAMDSRGFKARDYAKQALEGWRDSPGHRKNLLMPHLTEIGVAVARASARYPTYVAVQMFGRPASLKYEFTVRNTAGRVVPYEFAGSRHDLEPRQIVTHTACVPHTIEFSSETARRLGASARYEARNGDVYTVKPGQSGGITVTVDQQRQTN